MVKLLCSGSWVLFLIDGFGLSVLLLGFDCLELIRCGGLVTLVCVCYDCLVYVGFYDLVVFALIVLVYF